MNRVLLVDDNRSLLEGMAEALAPEELSLTLCETAEQALAAFAKKDYSVVVTDLKLPGLSGLELLREIKQHKARTVVIVITAHGTVNVAVDAMKSGAMDFVTKPFAADEIVVKVRKALEQYDLHKKVDLLQQETNVLRQEIKGYFDADQIVGESHELQGIKKSIEQLAKSKVAVLVLGETGTGKELIARAIHYRSDRRRGPFIRVNCAVFTETLLESELFGHEKGAFTGADSRKPGRFELADKGTIFLDEVGELSPAAQAKLLRVLQEHEFERVGGTQVVEVDVRVIAATNRNLEEEIQNKRFREDLYYRLNVVPVLLPPLRDRKEDIAPLLQHFLKRYASENHKSITGFTEEAMQLIQAHDWPGNIRELENMVERGVVLTESEYIDAPVLPFSAAASRVGDDGSGSLVERVDRFERRLIEETLRACGRNTTQAAGKLGISRSTLRYKIDKYSL